MKNSVIATIFFIHSSLYAIHPALFYEMHRQPATQWEIEQIQNDLTPFGKELSRKSLDETFSKEGLLLVRVKVRQGIITFEKSRDAAQHTVPDEVIPHFYSLNSLIPLPDIDFIFTAHDALSKDLLWPIFVITKQKEAKGILFPDWYALRGFEPARSEILEGNRLYPWESKTDSLFFRGGDSGVFDLTKWKEFPRAKLVALSLQFPHLIDARFALCLHHKSMLEWATNAGFIGNYVSMRDHPFYKYLMDIDGNCAATPRFPLFMFSNSVILKNSTNSVLWFYGAIKPYTHFIPVAEDLSDLLVQLDWAKNHRQECQKISENARRLANQALLQESAYVYLYRLLHAYAVKQRAVYNLE